MTLHDTVRVEDYNATVMDNGPDGYPSVFDKVSEPNKPHGSPALKSALKHTGSRDSLGSNRSSTQDPVSKGSTGRGAVPVVTEHKASQRDTPPAKPVQNTPPKPAEIVHHHNGHTNSQWNETPEPEVNIVHKPPNTQDTSVSERNKRPSLTPSVTYANSTPPSGTLADLKKHRAQQLQETLRLKENGKLRSSLEDSTVLPQNERNGHSPGMADSRSNSLTYLPEDRPMHRFTATQPSEIIGGDDSKTNCCIIL